MGLRLGLLRGEGSLPWIAYAAIRSLDRAGGYGFKPAVTTAGIATATLSCIATCGFVFLFDRSTVDAGLRAHVVESMLSSLLFIL